MKCYWNLPIEKLCPLLVAMILICILLLGCQSLSRYPSGSEVKQLSQTPVSLSPGDVVEVKFFYTPQLNETQTIGPDGKISLHLIGNVEAQGMTSTQLRNELVKLYAAHLTNPEITVIVRSFFSRRIFVGGKVMAPGIVKMPGKLTVLEAIMEAGGFDMSEAEIRNVIIIRHKDGQRYGYSIDLKPTLAGAETKPFYLEAQDIVYVPRTKIAEVGQWVDQYINNLIPRTGFIYSKSVNNTTIGVDTSSRY